MMRSLLLVTSLFLLLAATAASGCGLPEITDAGSGCLYDSDAGPLCPRPPVEAGARPDGGADGSSDGSTDGRAADADAAPTDASFDADD